MPKQHNIELRAVFDQSLPDMPKVLSELAVFHVKEMKRQRHMWRTTTKSFNSFKPTFEITQNYHIGVAPSNDVWVFTCFTKSNKYRFLELGTKIRHALMNPGYQPKTRPGRISSTGGIGGRRILLMKGNVYTRGWHKRGRKILPKPGLKARNWRNTIIKLRFRKYERGVRVEFQRLLNQHSTPLNPVARLLGRNARPVRVTSTTP